MTRVVPILFGALFTLATAWSLGMLLLRNAAPSLDAWERRLLALMAGSACLSEIMFALSAAKLVYRGVLLAVGFASIGYAIYSGTFRFPRKAFTRLAPWWRWIFIAAFAAFTWYGFFNALAPEHSSDGMAYHLSEVSIYQRAHGFPRITNDIYANLSQGIEMLYLFAFDFGEHSAASMVHYSLLIALVFLVLAYGRRIGRPAAGVAAAIFTYTCPVVLRDATTALIDVALAAVVFALFYLLQVWDDTRDPKLFAPIGILAGFGYAVKYTAFLAVPYALGLVAWRLWRARKPLLRPLLVIALLAAVMILPWMLKDWIEVANPVAPLANRIFPNPYAHISWEDGYRRYFSTYALHSRWQIPLEVTVKGDKLGGFLGPLFLLAPLGLLALRFREGRQLLLAGLLFGCTYFGNIGTRFLIPAVPFISLALALSIGNLPWLLLALLAANMVACWPSMYSRYCAQGAWRIENVPVKAALRIQSEDAYLSQDPDYKIVRMIGLVVPPGETIFAIGQGGKSYLPRELLTGYQSAANEVLQDILWTPAVEGYQPLRVLKFDFSAREFRKLRVVLKGSELEDYWSMAEVRVFDGPKELPRDPGWRLTAQPNPWDVQLAFDNSLVTRWRSWQPAKPGMYVEVDFPGLQRASSVTVESSYDSVNAKIALEGLGTDGRWSTISDHPTVSVRPINISLRIAATAELKARGIRYIVMHPEDPAADDFFRYPAAWGLSLVAQESGARLYRIQ
jgi:Dolichyl-phosphate-mannose-protein mannosyltransferase